MALKFGLVPELWQRGMHARDIVWNIRVSTDKDGNFVEATGRGHDIMSTVIDTYLLTKELPKTYPIPEEELKALIER